MKTKEFYIDTNRLTARGACIWGRTKFEEVFPEVLRGKKVLFTYENWEKARKGNLNLGWVATKILSFNAVLKLEDSYKGSLYKRNGYFTKRYSDVLYKAIKEKLEAE